MCILGAAVGITYYFQSIFGGFTAVALLHMMGTHSADLPLLLQTSVDLSTSMRVAKCLAVGFCSSVRGCFAGWFWIERVEGLGGQNGREAFGIAFPTNS